MARNRRRSRDAQPGDASALAALNGEPQDPLDPLRHASPDAELADAQVALGRPDLAEVPSEEELEEFEEADAARGGGGGASGGGRLTGGGGGGGSLGGGGGGELAVPGGRRVPATHAAESLPMRLVHFLQGSWRELQRVQWPDRRQVFQATGVVIGFVIVAGVFLGVADLVASKLVNLILK